MNPQITVADALAAWWLRQVTLRLRREVCWCRYQRDGASAEDGRLPPLVDPAQENLDLQRHHADKQRFFDSDVTAAYLSEQLRSVPKPAATGSRWVGLSEAAQFLLALALAARLDAALGPVCAAAQNDPARPFPTLALAQRLWDDPLAVAFVAHAGQALFSHGLLNAGQATREGLDWLHPVEMPTLVAHALLEPAGALPEGLTPLLPSPGMPMAEEGTVTLRWLAAYPPRKLQIVPLSGSLGCDYGEVAAACGAAAGRPVARLADETPVDRATLLPLATAAWLRGMDLLLPEDWAEQGERWFDGLGALPLRCYLPVTDPAQTRGLPAHALAPMLPVPQLGFEERLAVLRDGLGLRAAALGPAVTEAARRFRFQKATIARVTAALNIAGPAPGEAQLLGACRSQVTARLGTLAQRVEPRFSLAELVLPPAQARAVHDIVRAMGALTEVYYGWGAARAWNESGLSVLFAGGPGTGKTMAAEAISAELELPMYRVDLSQVVNKYIGETEKNLKHIFDAADQSDVVLFFDEADALFGKRTEVKDAQDRFANIEVSYMLERIERFKGLAILSTNRRKDLDEAFTRRLRYIVEFPMPGETERLRVWRQVFPPGADVSALDMAFLAEQFELSGGHIRSVALNACLQCAGDGNDGARVSMEHVLVAMRRELEKMGRPAHAGLFGPYAHHMEEQP